MKNGILLTSAGLRLCQNIKRVNAGNGSEMIRSYLKKRRVLQCTFALIDANIPPQPIDIDFINSLGEEMIPFVLAYTKTDRMKPEVLEKNLEAIQKALLEYWNELPQQFITSASLNTGQEEILQFIESINKQYFELH